MPRAAECDALQKFARIGSAKTEVKETVSKGVSNSQCSWNAEKSRREEKVGQNVGMVHKRYVAEPRDSV